MLPTPHFRPWAWAFTACPPSPPWAPRSTANWSLSISFPSSAIITTINNVSSSSSNWLGQKQSSLLPPHHHLSHRQLQLWLVQQPPPPSSTWCPLRLTRIWILPTPWKASRRQRRHLSSSQWKLRRWSWVVPVEVLSPRPEAVSRTPASTTRTATRPFPTALLLALQLRSPRLRLQLQRLLRRRFLLPLLMRFLLADSYTNSNHLHHHRSGFWCGCRWS